MSSFEITISTGTIKYQLCVSLVDADTTSERFKVFPKTNPDKFIIIQSNRPLLRNKYKLKHKPITWTIKEGEVKDNRNYQQLIKRLEQILEPPPPKKAISSISGTSRTTSRKIWPKGGTTLGERNK